MGAKRRGFTFSKTHRVTDDIRKERRAQKQEEFQCPRCHFSGRTEEEFKKHWKIAHTVMKGW